MTKYGATNGFTRKVTYKKAFQAIKRKGWTTRWPRGPKGEYTLLSAIRDSMDSDESLIDYVEEIFGELGIHPDHWEIRPGRTKQDVLDLIKSF